MHTPTQRDLYDLFAEDLVPEAFTIPSTAFRATVRPAPDGFDHWIGDALHDALAFRYPESGEYVHGIIIVQDGEVRFEWHHEPDHPMAWRVRVVKRELASFVAPWVLAAIVPGPRIGWVEHVDEHGSIDETPQVVDPDWVIPWYAEVRTPGLVDVRSGRESFHLGQHRTSRDTKPEQDGFARAMTELLRGHGSRRRHPRRSRSAG